MRSQLRGVVAHISSSVFLVAVGLCVLGSSAQALPASNRPSDTQQVQKAFNTPQEAAEELIQAAETYDVSVLLEIFGPDGKDFVSSADPIRDKSAAASFAAKAREKHVVALDSRDKTRAVLSVGKDDWPLPIPIVRKAGKWYFDSKQGRDEVLFRRIGSNELDALQVCRGFAEAQHEYASDIYDNSGINQYAQKIISTPGKHDGLYWKNDDGTSGGPISEAVARAIEEGYSPGKTSGYHGYYFKVLKGQGPAARFGKLDYVIDGAMIGGFALLAFPAEYQVTGVKSFLVGYDGVVYEKDLGLASLDVAQNIDRYNPDKTWHVTEDEWPAEASIAND